MTTAPGAHRRVFVARSVRALVATLVALVALGCGGDRRAPPAAPAVQSPVDAVPPDLDWVLRIDMGRVRSALGPTLVSALRDKAVGSQTEGASLFLADALERTNVLVVATRWDRGAFPDAVLALSGDFRGLDPRKYPAAPPWNPPLDLGGDVRRYDRGKPKARSDVMRLYLRSNDLIVAATEAELDSLEAVLERGEPSSRLKPRERGFVSAALRIRLGGPSARFPLLEEAFASTTSVEGFVDTVGDGFRVEASSELESEAAATHAKELLETARAAFENETGRVASIARRTKVEAQGKFVVVRAELGRDVLGQALGEALP